MVGPLLETHETVTLAYGQEESVAELIPAMLASFLESDRVVRKAGQRTTVSRGNGTTTSYGYDGGSRRTSLAQDLAGAASDQTQGLNYNPGSQVTQQTRSTDGYAFTQGFNANRTRGWRRSNADV